MLPTTCPDGNNLTIFVPRTSHEKTILEVFSMSRFLIEFLFQEFSSNVHDDGIVSKIELASEEVQRFQDLVSKTYHPVFVDYRPPVDPDLEFGILREACRLRVTLNCLLEAADRVRPQILNDFIERAAERSSLMRKMQAEEENGAQTADLASE
ncbi:hypothetical protein H2248_011864 [Termitomyces sp. 'cryptogamus']|nr:hypothetical protein H2248_011864 [Termitomyces sp. 'cryptogamus']